MSSHSPASARRRVLYITYDGLTDPLGQSQILPYLQGLSANGHEITVLSCEKPERAGDRAEIAKLCADHGIAWAPLPYHRSPPVISTVYDLWRVRRKASAMHRRRAFDLVHCRSYLPALVGLGLKRRFSLPFVFDMRGFWAEERVEAGDWNLRSPLYRAVFRFIKNRERVLLDEATHVVSLTRAAASDLAERGVPTALSVIPCCVDFAHFTPRDATARAHVRRQLDIPGGSSVLVYLGSLGGNHLLVEMMRLFAAFRDRSGPSKFLIVSQSERRLVDDAAKEVGIAADELRVVQAKRSEVPDLIAAADAGVAFKRPAFSALACSPTKLGELLACGVPVVANGGVGDVASILGTAKGGACVDSFDPVSLGLALDHLTDARRGHVLSQAARPLFDLHSGVREYDRIYRLVGQANDAIS